MKKTKQDKTKQTKKRKKKISCPFKLSQWNLFVFSVKITLKISTKLFLHRRAQKWTDSLHSLHDNSAILYTALFAHCETLFPTFTSISRSWYRLKLILETSFSVLVLPVPYTSCFVLMSRLRAKV